MANRFQDAIDIWTHGASNVREVARTLVEAADAAAQDGVQPHKDLAVRAIVAQLAFLCKTDGIGGLTGVERVGERLEQALAASLKKLKN